LGGREKQKRSRGITPRTKGGADTVSREEGVGKKKGAYGKQGRGGGGGLRRRKYRQTISISGGKQEPWRLALAQKSKTQHGEKEKRNEGGKKGNHTFDQKIVMVI